MTGTTPLNAAGRAFPGPLNVLVVDDSPFTRRAIARILQSDPRLRVIAQADEGHEALRLIEQLPIDVVTLDLAMPRLGGLEALRSVSAARRLPVVVLSALGDDVAIAAEALRLGAYRVLPKPAGGPLEIHAASEALLTAVLDAGGLDRAAQPLARRPARRSRIELVLIGVSTGGPSALQRVIPALPADFPVPVVVLQHMPPGHTRRLAERLDRSAAIAVREARQGDALQAGQVLLAPSGLHIGLRAQRGEYVVALREGCGVATHYRPCIDHTFEEAAAAFGSGVLGVVLTGMGRDGAAGVMAIKAAGGRAWAQDRPTSTIYGMPRAALDTGVLDEVLSIQRIPERLCEVVRP